MFDVFLVCGLGSLGQNCVLSLKKFGAKVVGIEKNQLLTWEIKTLPDLLDQLIIGNCSDKSILAGASINQCRAALIVTSSETINVETAIAIRQLNPEIRLVVRSAQKNLNELLSQQLGNFIAFDPTSLPITAFVMSALGTENLGLFSLENKKLRISQTQLQPSHLWCNYRLLSELNTRTRRIISHCRIEQDLPKGFYQWKPETRLLAYDQVVYIETEDNFRLYDYQAHDHGSKKI